MTATVDQPNDGTGVIALRKVSWRLLPLLGLGYGVAYMDRVNISFAALQMNQDLHFSASIYGLGAGLFFLSYALLEVPSNLLLVRFGARLWISRIMLTWGVLAVGMMFVRTPTQFYAMRFLLGAAEAGFFPGVIYYLTNWFPTAQSGRAISRFYIALPLSVAFMGAIAGPSLNLQGLAGLSGWQWLFLVQGAPAIVLSVVIFFYLPDSPARARWLTYGERAWILSRLSLERIRPGTSRNHRLSEGLTNPIVWKLGLCNLMIMASAYAFNLSVPTVLKGVTHWDATIIGLVMSGTALGGAVCMMLTGWHSDRREERYLHTVIPLGLMAMALTAIGSTTLASVIVPAYVIYYPASCAVQVTFWTIPSRMLRGPSAAVGLAAIGSIGMIGGFLGPFLWGLARDHTGGYQAGLLSLAVAYLAAAAILLLVRRAARANLAEMPMIKQQAGSA